MKKGVAAVDSEALRTRTKLFALRCFKVVDSLPSSFSGRTIAGQLVRSAASVGANYRAACRARSHAEFVAKMGIVEEELDESIYWFELIIDSRLKSPASLEPLIKEANELLSIIVASIRTARRSSNPQSAIRNSQSP